MKKLILLFFLIILINLVSAQQIEVVKEAKNSITKGENLDIKIIFNNPNNFDTVFDVKEILPQGITLINPSGPSGYEFHDGILTKVYKWQLSLKPKEVVSITYTISPDELGEYGIVQTTVTDKSSNLVYKSNSIQFIVYCNSNNLCEEKENYLNCPLDCGESIQDNLCNYKLDNTCDPDCEKDPDCSVSSFSPLAITFLILTLLIIVYLIAHFLNKGKNSP